MSEHDEVLWCSTCNTRQAHNLGGTGQNAVCMVCESVITGQSNIRQARQLGRLHYVTEWFQNGMDRYFEEMNKILNWRDVK